MRDNLLAAAERLRHEANRWQQHAKQRILLPDTNVYLHSSVPFYELDWLSLAGANEDTHVVVAVPLLIIDELDRAKHGQKRSQAGHTLGYLQPLLEEPTGEIPMPGQEGHRVSLQALFDDRGHRRLPRADDELVRQGLTIRTLATGDDGLQPPVSAITFDGGMAARSIRRGLSARFFAQPDIGWARKDASRVPGLPVRETMPSAI